jgi:hypothetical protein
MMDYGRRHDLTLSISLIQPYRSEAGNTSSRTTTAS